MFPEICATTASLSEPARVGDRHTTPARSPPVSLPSKATGLPGIMFATLRVSPAGRLGPNPYHPSPKVTNMLVLLLSCFSCAHSVRPYRWQPAGLHHPWDSPGKNTGVSCHFLLQCMKVKSESEVAQSCLTLSSPMHCSPPGSSIRGIFQARVLEWGAGASKWLRTN